MNFADIRKANSTLKTIDVKGNAYTSVNERIKAFRMLFPEGTIETEILHMGDGVIVMKATVSAEGKILATGTAHEKESSSYINKTSYVENCETSAVGRALGMLGIGIDTSVASAEEVENAIWKQQEIDEHKTHTCAVCGNPITDSKKTNGSVWKASDIAAYTLRKMGKEMCVDCAKKETQE